MINRRWIFVTLVLGFGLLMGGCDFFSTEEENTVAAKKVAIDPEAPR
jgi:hypothetical protein